MSNSSSQNSGGSTTQPVNSGTTPATQPPSHSQPAFRSTQDTEEAATISNVRKLADLVLKDADLSAPLKKKGFDEQKLNDTLALCDIAEEKFDARQTSIATQLEKTAQVTRLFNTAIKSYADFREIARTIYADEPSRKALSVTEPVPNALPEFLTQARSAYTTAKNAPYNAALPAKGYDTKALNVELAALDALRTADEEQSQLIGEAQKATAERREAVQPVRKFKQDLLRTARRVFRDEPEQVAKLDF